MHWLLGFHRCLKKKSLKKFPDLESNSIRPRIFFPYDGAGQRFVQEMWIIWRTWRSTLSGKKRLALFPSMSQSHSEVKTLNQRLLTAAREWISIWLQPVLISVHRKEELWDDDKFSLERPRHLMQSSGGANEELHKLSGISCKLIWKLLPVTLFPKKRFTLIQGKVSFLC